VTNRFLVLWTVAIFATVASFVIHLTLRGRTVDLGYQLGRARDEQGRLREVKRVLSLEAASHETPQRVEVVARTLLGMAPAPPERVIPMRALPLVPSRAAGDGPPSEPRPGFASPAASSSGASSLPPAGGRP
jgi:cell division protein FtsL